MSFEIFPRYSDHFEKKLNPTGAALTEKVDWTKDDYSDRISD